MELGTGVFLSAIFLGTVALFIATKGRWNWKKIFLWPLGVIVGLWVVGVSITYLYEQYDDRPRKLTELWGISLNDSTGDVKFKKGEPSQRLNNDIWHYQEGYDTSKGEYVVSFKNDRVQSVMYFGPMSYGPSLHGVGRNNSPQELDAKLGPPSYVSRTKNELSRLYSYEKFNIVVQFTEGKMSALGIYDPTMGAFKFNEESDKELKKQWFQSESWQDASENVAAKMGQEIELAQNLVSAEKNTTEVLVEKAHKYMASTLNAANTEKEELVAASNMFFGAYFLNTRTRANHCASLGVSIKSFVNAYEQKHNQLLVSAESIQIRDFEEHGYANSYDIDKLYKLISPSLEKIIVQEMKDVASTLEISERAACQSFERDSVEWVNEIDLRKRVPEIAQILLRK